jgi:uncharacterized secreted protein with C-terminal beta-propeller domain
VPAPKKPAPQKSQHSTTNVQEAGVDEADIVKTDGAHIFSVARGRLQAVSIRGDRPDLVDWLALERGFSHELLLRGERLLVISRGYLLHPLPGASAWMDVPATTKTILSEVDVSDPTHMRIVRELTFEGAYLSARLVGGTARIVTVSSEPRGLRFVQPQSDDQAAIDEAARRNREIVEASSARNWLPRYTLSGRGRAAKTRFVQCRQVRRPAAFSGLGLLTVLTIDLDKGVVPVDADAILSDGKIVYASPRSLYVATERWEDRPIDGRRRTGRAGVTTAIHKFGIGHPTQTRYHASGAVRGFLLNQWALSEHEDVLRVASTDARQSESFLTTLREDEGRLVTLAQVEGLGQGERIYAVRYLGEVGFVVTFQQVDPLYTLDLSQPARPRRLGELKIPGYSAYLHPLADDVLLGVGQDVRDGRLVGTQLSLFDVSNLRRPTRLHKRTIDAGWSEAEVDHHAFLYWPPAKLVVLPVVAATERFAGAMGFRLDREDGIAPAGRIVHAAGPLPIRRSLVVGDVLYTMSDLGIRSTELSTLSRGGWARFK